MPLPIDSYSECKHLKNRHDSFQKLISIFLAHLLVLCGALKFVNRDVVILLGDLVNKGPASVEVVSNKF